jgi:hypothetical protein
MAEPSCLLEAAVEGVDGSQGFGQDGNKALVDSTRLHEGV